MKATIQLTCEVNIIIRDPAVITRYTGPEGDYMRSQFYKLHTEFDVLRHLAYNCIANGCADATSLDGWADLSKDAVSMEIDHGSIESEDARISEATT